jgi:hypothetical protein
MKFIFEGQINHAENEVEQEEEICAIGHDPLCLWLARMQGDADAPYAGMG